ncbi:MAG TPA: ATP-binding protein [Solirubrobacterales bacterium]|nr:ATP-binding protein [Solirubrobacterales bacterium]
MSRTDCGKSSPSLRRRLAAAEAERARWARQLHDGTLQGLAELRMSLAAMEGADPFAVQDLLQRAIADLEREAERLRSLIVDLRPAALEREGIAAALELLADRVEKPKLEVVTRIELGLAKGGAAVRFDEECESAVYRIVQAALDNAVKHAEASRAVVEVVEDADRGEIVVTVSDDGNGFDPASEGEGGGLRGMREWVAVVGGSLEIRAGVDQGAAICAAVPSRRRISTSVSAI